MSGYARSGGNAPGVAHYVTVGVVSDELRQVGRQAGRVVGILGLVDVRAVLVQLECDVWVIVIYAVGGDVVGEGVAVGIGIVVRLYHFRLNARTAVNPVPADAVVQVSLS